MLKTNCHTPEEFNMVKDGIIKMGYCLFAYLPHLNIQYSENHFINYDNIVES